MGDTPLLEVKNLHTEFDTERGTVRAVDGVDYTIESGETFGFVGESGAGKSVTGLSVLNLVKNPGRITDGEIRYKGQNLLKLSEDEWRNIRGSEISIIFQDPMTSLNPTYTVGTQLVDTIEEHLDLGKTAARDRAIELLGEVGIPDAAARIDDYPHQFSGGMRQRVLVAMAISCEPSLIIADEPTTALDVTIQAQILDLLVDLQDEYDIAIQVITHNMGVIAELCDRLAIMYAGEIVEIGDITAVFESPHHPYTVGLKKAIPQIDDPRESLETIPGNMPDLIETPSGCSFRNRCPHATEECAEIDPPLEAVSGQHHSACIRMDEIDFQEELEITADESRSGPESTGETVLDVDGLQKYFEPESTSWLERLLGNTNMVHAVDDVSLSISEGETLGLVGESGCGKTTLGRTITQLYEPDAGTVLFAGSELTDLDSGDLRRKRLGSPLAVLALAAVAFFPVAIGR